MKAWQIWSPSQVRHRCHTQLRADPVCVVCVQPHSFITFLKAFTCCLSCIRDGLGTNIFGAPLLTRAAYLHADAAYHRLSAIFNSICIGVAVKSSSSCAYSKVSVRLVPPSLTHSMHLLQLLTLLLVQCSLSRNPLAQKDAGARACRSFKICHNSKGAAWTTVQLFSALEPLLSELQLEPATDYVEVTPLQGCLASGCCCSTPVEVKFSLPVPGDQHKAAAQVAALTHFLKHKLPRELQGTACTASRLGHCSLARTTEKKSPK